MKVKQFFDAFMATDVMKSAETDTKGASLVRLNSVESKSHTRSLSSSSFDSCSDLLDSLDLPQKGVQQQDRKSFTEENNAEREREASNIYLFRSEVPNSFNEDSEGHSTLINDSQEVLSDQMLERSALPQSCSPDTPLCKSPSSCESVNLVTCSKMAGRQPIDSEIMASDMSITASLHSKHSGKHGQCINKGMEASKDNQDNIVVRDSDPSQRTKDGGSVILLPSRDLNEEDPSTEDVVDWHIQRFLNSEMEEINAKPYQSSSMNFECQQASEITDIVTDDAYGTPQLLVKGEQGETLGDMENCNIPAIDFKDVDPLKLPSSQNLSGEESLQTQEHTDGMEIGVKDQYCSSSNVPFVQGDWDEFAQEKVTEKTFDINPGTFEVVEGADHVTKDHGHTQFMEERMCDISDSDGDLQQLEDTKRMRDISDSDDLQQLEDTKRMRDISDSDDDLQQLEDTIKFFDLHKSNTSVPHPLNSLSSGSGRPDLEEVDKQFVVSGSFTKNRLMTDEQVHSGGKGLRLSADSLNQAEVMHWPLLEEDIIGKETSPQFKSRNAFGWEKKDLGPDELSRYVEALDFNETYVDTVLDMEDVLLNSDESSRGRFLHTAGGTMIGTPRPSRDGSVSSSTSGTQIFSSDHTSSARDIPFTIDWVEVVGARQRKGGSSLGERMVGVKDHTVYCIKVVSGKAEWEVSRRYRDFVDLYHQLRRIFNTQEGKSLPSPWEEVDYESRKVFGSISTNVIEVRSYRIERCLQSLLQEGPPFNTASPLFWFLRPKSADGWSNFQDHLPVQASSAQHGSNVQLGALDSPQLQSPKSDTGSNRTELDQDRSPFILGNTIKLVLKIHSHKSVKQLLYAQHHSCAGCYKHLDLEKGVVQGLFQTFGWRKPRFCEYSGQLFCASCHLNETAVLPAQVLRNWDFTARRVCQLAKAYLDSIYDQPMLCVSAVNPYLYSRVSILSHIKETRRKLGRMLSCVHCPSRSRIQQTLGSRRYLLENNDFFALRDLEDLSKGAFAVLPGLLTAVMENLKVHITKQCSVCQDTGEWCGAGILCEDPFSPIFPFQEENIVHCKICRAPFHQSCFMKCYPCPCCAKDWSDEIHASNDVTAFSDTPSIARNASSSSLGVPECQGSSNELEGKPQRNWALNNLFKRQKS